MPILRPQPPLVEGSSVPSTWYLPASSPLSSSHSPFPSAAFILRTDIAPIVHGVTVALALGPNKKVIAPRSSESPNAFPLIWISKRLGSLFPSRLVRNGVSALVQGGQDAVGM
ncbi:hypothetical protein N7533_000809 [Penicillium manginii]|uniref:uncharacterized protein n=1 Tax=Penicillium manginii TaxID=203109 RepID=UPI002547268B|nr:uncharacterized protein N7533_000809 [Penicillium manginii]KAJ5768226.1 hypothetical protein N7533_000809 [Penicillium manginii]